MLQFSRYIPAMLALMSACQGGKGPPSKTEGGQSPVLVVSEAFEGGGLIPVRYTCDGEDISPPIHWSGIPQGTRSLSLVCEDPDAPAGTWIHWVVFDIPPGLDGFREAVPGVKTLEGGAKQGLNDFHRIGYGGPCPPRGSHRYFFRLYALDTIIPLEAGATREELMKAMEGHVIADGVLMGRYRRR